MVLNIILSSIVGFLGLLSLLVVGSLINQIGRVDKLIKDGVKNGVEQHMKDYKILDRLTNNETLINHKTEMVNNRLGGVETRVARLEEENDVAY